MRQLQIRMCHAVSRLFHNDELAGQYATRLHNLAASSQCNNMNIGTRVPTEILCEIFLLLRDKPIALHELKNRSRFNEFPWAVGRVCRRWRSVFLSYPALWSTLSIEEPRLNSIKRTSSVAYIAEMSRRTTIYLRRSGRHPLTIIVRVSSVASYTAVWSMLLLRSDLWKKADLWISNGYMLYGLIRRRGRMPILESLKITVVNFRCHKGLGAFDIAPRLTELELVHREGIKSGKLGRWSFPWAQLTKLKMRVPYLDFAHISALRTFLLQVQNLEELRFLIDDVKEEFGIFKCPSVRFPRLRLLEISVVFPGVFSWFEAPVLEHLLVHDCFDLDTYALRDYKEELSSFLHRSSCHVRHLTLQSCDIDVAEDIMVSLASVEELCIKEAPEAGLGILLSCIIRGVAAPDGVVCLPNLRVLRVPCCLGQFGYAIIDADSLLKARNKESGSVPATSSTNIVPLEKVVVTVDWKHCWSSGCNVFDKGSTREIDRVLDISSCFGSWRSGRSHDPLSQGSRSVPVLFSRKSQTL